MYDLTYMWDLKNKIKFIETESRLVVARSWGKQGDVCLSKVTNFQF